MRSKRYLGALTAITLACAASVVCAQAPAAGDLAKRNEFLQTVVNAYAQKLAGVTDQLVTAEAVVEMLRKQVAEKQPAPQQQPAPPATK